MSYYYIILAAFVTTIFLTLIISLISRRPLSGLGIFFLLVFLSTWSVQLWIRPFGPLYWGIDWISLLIVSLFISILVLALAPPVKNTGNDTENADEKVLVALGTLLWIIIIVLLISIIIGYYRFYHYNNYNNKVIVVLEYLKK